MKKKTFISIVIVSVFLLSGILTVALAGVDPEPFNNQLGAVENIIESALDRVEKVMGIDPSPFEPSPNVKGAVNRLEAINNQLVSADDMVRSIAEEVMGIDPQPFHPDIVIAFEGVRDAAQSIVDSIDSMSPPPDDTMPFGNAIINVQVSAQAIVDTVTYYLELPSDCGFCAEITSPDICGSTDGCSWISDHCCADPG